MLLNKRTMEDNREDKSQPRVFSLSHATHPIMSRTGVQSPNKGLVDLLIGVDNAELHY